MRGLSAGDQPADGSIFAQGDKGKKGGRVSIEAKGKPSL